MGMVTNGVEMKRNGYKVAEKEQVKKEEISRTVAYIHADSL